MEKFYFSSDKSIGKTYTMKKAIALGSTLAMMAVLLAVPAGASHWSNDVSVSNRNFAAVGNDVSATAALVIANGITGPDAVRTKLESTADDLVDTGKDTTYGWGLLNAAAALDSLLPTPTPTPGTIFFDDFESGNLSNWIESNEFDWTVEPEKEKDVPSHPSNNLVAHADRCSSSIGCILTQKNSVDLTEYTSAALSFWRYVDRGLDRNEFLRVEIYDGSSWITLLYWTHRNGDTDQWHHETIDITSYLNSGFKVRFTSRESSSGEETEIDDVKIEASL